MLENGPAAALSGPIERGDGGTVEKHLAALDAEDRELYRLLGKKVLAVAERKNPNRNYENIEEILQESGVEKTRQMEV